jgi:hypothetical protein
MIYNALEINEQKIAKKQAFRIVVPLKQALFSCCLTGGGGLFMRRQLTPMVATGLAASVATTFVVDAECIVVTKAKPPTLKMLCFRRHNGSSNRVACDTDKTRERSHTPSAKSWWLVSLNSHKIRTQTNQAIAAQNTLMSDNNESGTSPISTILCS